MIKIAPSAVHPVSLPDHSEEVPLRQEIDDNKSESSKLRLKIKK